MVSESQLNLYLFLLQNHLNLHTGMRPYKCIFCELSYANGPNLRAHKKKCHSVELAAMEGASQERI